jgi:FdhD protein
VKRLSSKWRASVQVVDGMNVRERLDDLAVEEPLEIRLLRGGVAKPLAVTMRTPGSDFELAAGFLYAEGIVRHRGEIERMGYCTAPEVNPKREQTPYHTVNVHLRGGMKLDSPLLERHFVVSSACGVCGKASLEALKIREHPEINRGVAVDSGVITSLPEALRASQKVFARTGGLHAAAAFTLAGELLEVREDVGRHNAVDKLIGWALLEGELPFAEHILLVSGRSSFEIMQKALMAGFPIVCAVSAPSSLAVRLAREFGLTLIGFLRQGRFNIYAHPDRVRRPR